MSSRLPALSAFAFAADPAALAFPRAPVCAEAPRVSAITVIAMVRMRRNDFVFSTMRVLQVGILSTIALCQYRTQPLARRVATRAGPGGPPTSSRHGILQSIYLDFTEHRHVTR